MDSSEPIHPKVLELLDTLACATGEALARQEERIAQLERERTPISGAAATALKEREAPRVPGRRICEDCGGLEEHIQGSGGVVSVCLVCAPQKAAAVVRKSAPAIVERPIPADVLLGTIKELRLRSSPPEKP